MNSFQDSANVDIQLPRLKYEYEITLNEVLSDMGMGVAFSGAADFTGINKGGNLKIDYVKHKTFIDVNEKGTEAAAVTIVAIELTSVEFSLLAVLLEKAGQIISREELVQSVLGRRLSPYDRSIDVHISALRKKLGHFNANSERIKTVRGVGYLYARSKTKSENEGMN